MELGIDLAAFTEDSRAVSGSDRLGERIAQIERADALGLVRNRRAPSSRAPRLRAGRHPRRSRLTSAVTVLSAADPVRLFQEFATLDLLSHGRAWWSAADPRSRFSLLRLRPCRLRRGVCREGRAAPHAKLMQAIELIGARVAPVVRQRHGRIAT